MNRIEKLIEEMCPEGVTVDTLSNHFTRNSGISITAARMKELESGTDSIRVFAGGKTRVDAKREEIPQEGIISEPGVIVKSRGHIDFEYCDVDFTHKNELWSYTPKSNLVEVKFLYYFLKTKVTFFRNLAASKSVKMPQLASPDTEKFQIPVPPLEIQKEIVNILDKFIQLEAELEAELEAREKQYEEVRRRLLDFESDTSNHPLGETIREMCPEGVETKSLGESCDVKAGGSVSKAKINQNPGPYPVIGSGKEPLGFINDFNTDNDPIGIASRGAGVGQLTWTEGRFFRGNLNYSCTPRDESILNKRFLYHSLLSSENKIMSLSTYQGIPALNAGSLKSLEIFIPPLEIQKEIVRILDNLDLLVNSVNEGIPAEIAARRKQYEHYRDKLLTFKELDAA